MSQRPDPVEHVGARLASAGDKSDRDRLEALDEVAVWLEGELEEVSRAADRHATGQPASGVAKDRG